MEQLDVAWCVQQKGDVLHGKPGHMPCGMCIGNAFEAVALQ